MKIINFEDIVGNDIYDTSIVLNEVYLTNYEDRLKIIEAANYSIDKLKEWFDELSIEYDDIQIFGKNIIYSVGDSQLMITDLSHGERTMLLLLAYKETGETVIVESLFEILGSTLRKAFVKLFKSCDNIIVTLYNAFPPFELKEYLVRKI